MSITKSLWKEITEAAASVPASTDLLLFAAQPGAVFQNQSNHCTIADLLTGLGLIIPIGEIVFGTGNGFDSSPSFTIDPELGISILPQLSLVTWDAALGLFAEWTPPALANHVIAADLSLQINGTNDFVFGIGTFVSLVNNNTLATPSFLTALDIFIDGSSGTVGTVSGIRVEFGGLATAGTGDQIALNVIDVNGAINNYVMKAGRGKIDLHSQGLLFDSATDNLTIKGTFQAANYQSGDGSAGIDTTITTASLVGKTITVKDGLITGFA